MSQPGNTPPESIRAPLPSDQSYICDSWVRSLLRRGASYDKREAAPLVALVNRILDRSDTHVLIRHSPLDANEIRGWVVYAMALRTPVVHWCYCRKQYRERGYATALLQAAGVTPRTALVYTTLPTGQPARKLIAQYPAAVLVPVAEFLDAGGM